jgi:hypothetical protein
MKNKLNSGIISFFIISVLLFSSFHSIAQYPADPATNMAKQGVLTLPSTNEKGYSDFPFTTTGGIVVGLTLSGNYTSYYDAWLSCSVSTKAESIWLGQSGVGVLRNTFSSPVNNVEYNITASNVGEILTVTVSNGTPSISIVSDCNASVSGNVLSFTSDGGGSGIASGAKIKITSTEPYSWVDLSHDGDGSGSLFTLDGNSLDGSPVPLSIWTTILGFSLIMVFIVIRKRFF